MAQIVLKDPLICSGNAISVASGLYATHKDKYVEHCRDTISKMKKEIASLEKTMTVIGSANPEYKNYQKKIARRKEIIKNCEQAIYFTTIQMNLPTHARFRCL